jgi:NTE family protein
MRTGYKSVNPCFPRLSELYFACFLLILMIPVCVMAQDQVKRPAVGLVLSGGGAHGIAHLGVIRVMEEAGLRPDYITGVSMGSIIGGMYSLGYSADSVYKILKKINWGLILSNKLPENKLIFSEKDNYYNSIISLPVSFKKFVLPSGLINGQLIENTLSYYSWPAADIPDFSRLPVPFMCVATDLITYSKVDLKTGYLPDAIRASFSVPSIFTPLKIDTLLLVDGGLLRNFAATEAKEMGAEILIGSYTGFKAYKEKDLQSLSGIIRQIAFFRSLEDFNKEKKLIRVLIIPEMGKLSATDFENVDSLVERGYEAALPYKEYFRKLADSLDHIGKQSPLKNILDKQTYTFDKVEIRGNKYYPDDQIRGVLDIDPGEKVDKNMLSDRIDLLYGKSWFEKVSYRFVPRNDSLILVIDCAERPKAMLYGAVHYDNILNSGLIVRLSVKNLLTQKSDLNIYSYIAQYYRFKFRFLQFIDSYEKYGISANFYSDNTLAPMLDIKGEKGGVIIRNFIPGISLSHSIGLNQMMNLSGRLESSAQILRYIPDDHLKSRSFNYMTYGYDYQINSVDTKYFPNRGVIMSISAETTKLLSASEKSDTSSGVFRINEISGFSPQRFFTINAHLKQYFSSGGKMTWSVGGDALFISASDSVSSRNNFYLLGGIDPVSKRSIAMAGYQSNEIAIQKMAGIRAGVDMELFRDFHLELIANFAAIQEVNRSDGYTFLSGYGLVAGYMSVMGPLRIGIMYGNGNHDEYFNNIKGYISLGYNF